MSSELQNYTELIKNAPLYTIQLVPVNALVIADYNPQTTTDEDLAALRASMIANKDYLKARPIIANTWEGREGIVVGGAKRLRAAISMGWPKVPVMFVKTEPLREKVWNMLDNQKFGEWDEEKRHKIVMELHQAKFDLSGIGFKPNALVGIMKFQPVDPKDNPDSAKGTTGKKKKEVVCPNCSHKFTA